MSDPTQADGPDPRSTGVSSGATALSEGDKQVLEALRRGDEQAFTSLVEEYYAPLLRVALLYVQSRAVAEEVVQETWVGVLHGLDRFEGRSSLKTWIFRILTNTAKTRARREGRSIPFSALVEQEASGDEPSVDADRFLPADHPQWSGHWSSIPPNWQDIPEDRLLSLETRQRIRDAIESLPPVQRTVITLRDVEGWTSEDVCNLLQVSESNQRVLLHRARSRVRRALEQYLTGE